MRVADYIFKTLADRGVGHVFLVTGGGAMQLNDALRREKRIRPVCCHHEQACAIAAEGYVRGGAPLGVVSVTSGPGGTNTLTGVIGQWLDSIPVLYLSGQVKMETTIRSCPELKLRQLGDQEINIVDIVRPVTKYAAFVDDPKQIRVELEKALFHARNGRPGPVWLDIPLDVQGAPVDESELEIFIPDETPPPSPAPGETARLLAMLEKAERPVIVAGHGIRLAGAREEFLELLRLLPVPVTTTFGGFDLIPDGHPLFSGRIGTLGQRAGNFVLQNADLILSIGSRNNIRQVGYQWESCGRAAKKVSIDIDGEELKKKSFVPDLAIRADAGSFIRALKNAVPEHFISGWKPWRAWCAERRRRFPSVTEEQRRWSDGINPYFFMHELTSLLPSATDVVAGNGTACVALFQSGVVKAGQHQFWNSGCASMGYDLPAAAGACIASGRETVCLAGDGSFMMNMQELQTILHHRLPLKIFLLDNNGYGSIKQTQGNFFSKEELIGCDAPSGTSFPDFLKVAEAFGYPVFELAAQVNLKEKLAEILRTPGPLFCAVRMPDRFAFAPKVSSKRLPDGKMFSAPLEDMFPFLSREEFRENMIVEPVPEK